MDELRDPQNISDAIEDAPDDGIRFINEYLYENDLLTNFARLQATGARRTLLAVVGVACIVGGVAWFVLDRSLGWLGIVVVLVGIYLLWHRSQLHHNYARRYIDAMEKDSTSFGDRYRRVAVSDEGLMVFARDGRSRYYRFSDLTRVQQDDLMFVLLFGLDGVCLPRAAFQRGNAQEFERFLESLSSSHR
ncbi:YcxB family protein [Enorma phocaeensis]|uniref:YcxB family protein n=1 Tax=Enorma phocaeensis TaxID=1871019 RepID=UPI0019564807|nr:YcxB family protein [Enorma phocaeensis]MBM6953969.1 YcxB family protein [Enorma phocaeensis]